jgi:hypothetical protein
MEMFEAAFSMRSLQMICTEDQELVRETLGTQLEEYEVGVRFLSVCEEVGPVADERPLLEDNEDWD